MGRSECNNVGKNYTSLDINQKLLCSITEDISSCKENMLSDDSNEDNNECAICLSVMKDPYKLVCGHAFCFRCLFSYIFPDLRNSDHGNMNDNNNRDKYAHQILATIPHLSYTLGRTRCPYCRQVLKPSISRAFALNLI